MYLCLSPVVLGSKWSATHKVTQNTQLLDNNNNNNCLTAFCLGLPGWAGTRRNIHPLTPVLIINHPSSTSPYTTIHSILFIKFTCLAVLLDSDWISNNNKSLNKFHLLMPKKGSPYSITERRVPELTLVLGSQPAGDVNHKPGDRLPLLSARPAVTPATLKRAAANFAAWWTEAQWVWTICLRLLGSSVATAIWTRALLHLSPAC